LEEKKTHFYRELDEEGIYYSGVGFTSCMPSGPASLHGVCTWRNSVVSRACPDL